MKFSRRAVLAGFGAGVADNALAGSSLAVTDTGDGGFAVFVNFHEAWHISGNDIKQAWGSTATTVVIPANPGPCVSISGFLLGKTAKLKLSFLQRLTGWVCRFDLQLQALGRSRIEIQFPFVGPAKTPIISVPFSASLWRQAVGFPAGTAIFRPRLEIARQTLTPTLSGPFVFEDFGGFRVDGPLKILPGTDNGSPVARLELRSSEILKLADGWSIEANGMRASFPGKRPNSLVLEGDGILQIGKVRFAGDKNSSIQCYREGSHAWEWKADWRLPDHEQAIDTPHGRFNVVGAGGTDISAHGTSRLVEKYAGSAQLRHAAFRLPLEGKGQNYADLGRLDFDSAGRSQVSFKIARFGKPTEASWISLDSNDPDPLHIQLDSARLRVARQADLFHGCFRFTGIALSQTKNGLFLTRCPSAPANTCLLKVELPPQHVREESFGRQLPVLPGGQLRADELAMVFDVSQRRKLQDNLLSKSDSDPNFKEFASKYRDKYTNYSGSVFAKPSGSTFALEQIYVGPDGLLSLLGRYLANKLASEISKEKGLKIADIPLSLDAITVGDVLRRHRTPQSKPPWTPANAQLAFAELLIEAAKRNDDHSLLQNWYRKNNPAAGQFYVVEWLTSWPNKFPKGSTTSVDLKDMLERNT